MERIWDERQNPALDVARALASGMMSAVILLAECDGLDADKMLSAIGLTIAGEDV